jgi:glycosyltransferase involved in cell wall biosynthesis
MKILYIITRAERGGAPRHLVDLMTAFSGTYDISLMIGENGYVVEEANILQIPVFINDFLKRNISIIDDFKAIVEAIRIIRQVKPTLIHAHTFKAGLIARISGFFTKTPVIYTPHGWNFAPRAPFLWRMFTPIAEKILAHFTEKIICVSDYEFNLAKSNKICKLDKFKVVKNGIKNENIRANSGNITQEIKIVMVARFIEPKTQNILIKAMTTLPEGATLIFVGDGPLLNSMIHLVSELKLGDKISFLGNRSDIYDILKECHIFVLSTDWEGLPLTILEAMCLGLPVVASDVGGISEAIENGKSGFLFPPNNIDTLRHQLVQLIENPLLRANVGNLGRKKFEAQFMFPKQLTETHQLYEEIIRNKYLD